MPVVSGTDIGLDNTCKSVFSVQEFFGKSGDVHQRAVLDELMAYQLALEFDINLLDQAPELKKQKQERLQQIKEYSEVIQEILKSKVLYDLGKALPRYPKPLQTLMTANDANVYTMLLRPKVLDEYIRFANPVFSVDRTSHGLFYKALMDVFKHIKEIPGARARIVSAVMASSAAKRMDVAGIQQALQGEFKKQLKTEIDFTKTPDGRVLNQASIDNVMIYGADNPASSEGYIDALLHYCAQDFFAQVIEPPFYSAKHYDELANITQFFLAQVNIYCRIHKMSLTNFGAILDADEDLSTTLAAIVQSCLLSGAPVEDAILDFINQQSDTFGLSALLLPVEQALIKRQFTRHFAQIKESKEFDEFIILDASKKGPFFSYQNAISLQFADFSHEGFPELKKEFFKKVKDDFKLLLLNEPIPPNNPWIHQTVEVSLDALLNQIHTEEQLHNVLTKLPDEQKQEVMKSPIVQKLQAQKFLHCVARGQQKEAEDLLKANPDANFLLEEGTFTDYSGRTFNCTAYEYAYWAKDKHMLRMLEQYIVQDEATKEELLNRCTAIEAHGLNYLQHDIPITGSKHFDLQPLETAYNEYIKAHDAWRDTNFSNAGEAALVTAWMNVGMAQRELPTHYVNEYFRKERSFDPLPKFDEPDLPREITFYNYNTGRVESLFPLKISATAGLGVDFAFGQRARWGGFGTRGGARRGAGHDLAAVSRLDAIRTEDLKQSLETLKPSEPGAQAACVL
jgi:hypothetical protein